MVATGCTAVVEGTPSAPSGVLLPPRPREVRLDGVDPCSLLKPEQRAELGFTSRPTLSRPYVELFRGDVPTCTMYGSSPGAVLLGVGAVTTAGIERWKDDDLAARLRRTVVAGFPALVAVPTQSTAYCSVEVDVAPGQLLDVQVTDGGDTPPVPQEHLCTRASRTAEEMTQTLLSR
jgi:hypothetical protein